jgi:hypothetical protein
MGYRERQYEKRDMYARMSKEDDAAAFQRWRAQVTFTDEQIAVVLEQAAADTEHVNPFLASIYRRQSMKIRQSGRLTKAMLRIALPRLVTTCGLCGAKAIYLYGCDGRCSKHRDQRPDFTVRKFQQYDAKGAFMEAMRKQSDYIDLDRRSLKASLRSRKGKA